MLIAQVSGVQAKLDWGNHPADIYRNDGPASFDPAEETKMAAIKAEGRVYQAQLEADYQTYVKNAETQNKINAVKGWTPFQILSKAEWLRYGKPEGNPQ